jgi:hypothetical protein
VPVALNRAVYIIHPDHHGDAIAKGKAGVHYKLPKGKMEGRVCDIGVQWVHVQRVFLPGVRPMYWKKQSHVMVVEDAITDFAEDAWIQWNPDYLIEMK